MKLSEDVFARHMKPITGSAIREIFHLLAKPGMISFAGGNPSNAALEPEVIAPFASAALEKYGASLLQYGATEGFAPLRESVAEFVAECGVKATAENVLPTQGSGQALDLLLKAVINPGDAVIVESPTFLGAIQAMRTYQATLIGAPTDEQGVIVEALEEAIKRYHPKLMYLIPTFQNPTGKTLPLERRKRVAELAAKYGVLVAEDDPYRDLRYSGEALPAIKSFDEEGWVVYLTSFSKYIAPGLRVGAAIADKLLMRKLIIGKQSADVHSPLLTQAIVDGYLRCGGLPAHIDRIKVGYREQLGAMIEGFKYLPEGTVRAEAEGGLFLWATLPEGMDALRLLPAAVERNVAYVPGTHFYPEGGHLNTLRLNFSNTPVELIDKGMRALGEALKNG